MCSEVRRATYRATSDIGSPQGIADRAFQALQRDGEQPGIARIAWDALAQSAFAHGFEFDSEVPATRFCDDLVARAYDAQSEVAARSAGDPQVDAARDHFLTEASRRAPQALRRIAGHGEPARWLNTMEAGDNDAALGAVFLLERAAKIQCLADEIIAAGGIEPLRRYARPWRRPVWSIAENALRSRPLGGDIRGTSVHAALRRSDHNLEPLAARVRAQGPELLDTRDGHGVRAGDIAPQFGRAVEYLAAVGADLGDRFDSADIAARATAGRQRRRQFHAQAQAAVLEATDIISPDSAGLIASYLDPVDGIEPQRIP